MAIGWGRETGKPSGAPRRGLYYSTWCYLSGQTEDRVSGIYRATYGTESYVYGTG